SCTAKPMHKFTQISNDQRWMGFTCRPKIRLDTEVDLNPIALEPNATPFGQSWRLWNLRYFKQTRVKMPGGVLLPGGHGELNVFYCFDLHSSYSRNSAPVEYPDIVLISTATANLFSGAEATATVLQFVTDGNRALAGTTLTACGEYQ